MHIAEGILTSSATGIVELIAGWGITGAATGFALWRMEDRKIPTVALLSAAFFVVSMVHIPIGPGSVHLILSGLIGLLLGWAAFPAIAIALLLQFLLFSYGGITTLGVNTAIMATPGVACHYFFGSFVRRGSQGTVLWASTLSGSLAVVGSMGLYFLVLVFAREDLRYLAQIVNLSHFPLFFLEGAFTGMIVTFLYRVRPELLWMASPNRPISSVRETQSAVPDL